jgi:putative MATE family efflux protein
MPTVESAKKGIYAVFVLLKQSLSGENMDYTTGSIRRAVFLLSIPMVLEMSMESLFAVVDLFFVGRIGKEAVAAVGLTESVLTIVYSIAVGLSMAATALVSRRIGEKDEQGAAKSAAQSMLIGLILTLAISLCGALFAPSVLRIMGAPKEVILQGASYTRILFCGNIVIVLLYLINGIFRGAGNASIAMWSLWIGNGCNIILCPILIHFYGLPGAAIATTAGRGIGVCYQLRHLFRGGGRVRLARSYFIPDPVIIRNILRIAWTGTVQFMIGSASWIAMTRIIAYFGDEAIAGYQVFIRILLFFILPAWGVSNAAATLVGQNLGARQAERAEKSVWTAAKYNALFMLFVSLLFLFCSEPIVGFLNRDPAIEKIAIRALHIVSLGYVFYGVGMVVINAFNGAGDTRTPTLINLFCFWAFQIPVALLMAFVLKLGPQGVFLAILLSESAVSITGFILFKKGSWKNVKL